MRVFRPFPEGLLGSWRMPPSVRVTMLRSYGWVQVSDSGRLRMDETSAVSEVRVATLNFWGRRGA